MGSQVNGVDPNAFDEAPDAGPWPSRSAKPYWELHVTLAKDARVSALRAAVELAGWTFSCITDDPILGAGPKAYATKHLNRRLYDERHACSVVLGMGHAMRLSGFTVLREKVELVCVDIRHKP
jgi:hypothetical protein